MSVSPVPSTGTILAPGMMLQPQWMHQAGDFGAVQVTPVSQIGTEAQMKAVTSSSMLPAAQQLIKIGKDGLPQVNIYA